MKTVQTATDAEGARSLHAVVRPLGRVESQSLRSNGVWTEYSSGAGILRPYKVDESGEIYVDLFPNDEANGPNDGIQRQEPRQ